MIYSITVFFALSLSPYIVYITTHICILVVIFIVHSRFCICSVFYVLLPFICIYLYIYENALFLFYGDFLTFCQDEK